jgi:hypothetical protein
MIHTTLNKLWEYKPCHHGWQKLLQSLKKTNPDDEPLTLLTIINSNGYSDALWAVRACVADDALVRQFMLWCAHRCKHHIKTAQLHELLKLVELYITNTKALELMNHEVFNHIYKPILPQELSAWCTTWQHPKQAIITNSWNSAKAIAIYNGDQINHNKFKHERQQQEHIFREMFTQ